MDKIAEMLTQRSAQLRALVGNANAATGAEDSTISAAVARLIDGYGGGESDMLDALLGIRHEEIVAVCGYDAGNTTAENASVTPFILPNGLYSFADGLRVAKIKINAKTAGLLHIGYIESRYAVAGAALDESKIHYMEVCTIPAGTNTIDLPKPFVLPSGCDIVIGKRGESTAVFYYGSNGEKGFDYVYNGLLVPSTSSLGIDIIGSEYAANRSTYSGKKLSILGDSISTFAGWIPEGHATYYPAEGVNLVQDTWWWKLSKALGMELLVNESWSGSRVTTTNGEASAGCMSRCEALGDAPDVIIVYMGINDFNGGVDIGSYDGRTALPEVTTTFREAYAVMLNKILTKYKRSEVWVCTLPAEERTTPFGFPEINSNGVALAEYNAAIMELADAFGVRVLHHHRCGLTYQNMSIYDPNALHPIPAGHSLIANNAIREMDASVRRRY